MAGRRVRAGVRDDSASVRVTEEYDFSVDLVELGAHLRDVGVEAGAGQIDRTGGDAAVPHQRQHSVEAPRAVPCSVDEHDGRRPDLHPSSVRRGTRSDRGLEKPAEPLRLGREVSGPLSVATSGEARLLSVSAARPV
jgi:hypothetical protein